MQGHMQLDERGVSNRQQRVWLCLILYLGTLCGLHSEVPVEEVGKLEVLHGSVAVKRAGQVSAPIRAKRERFVMKECEKEPLCTYR
jgi:hypothetical protein